MTPGTVGKKLLLTGNLVRTQPPETGTGPATTGLSPRHNKKTTCCNARVTDKVDWDILPPPDSRLLKRPRRMRELLACFLIPAFILCAMSRALSNESPLEALRWSKRVLLVFAPDGRDPRLQELTASLDVSRCESLERDLIVGRIVLAGESYLGEDQISEESAALLRRRFNTPYAEFLVLLIGKDGGIKATYNTVPAISAIFGLIDGMPMRRREARSSAAPCAG